MHDRLKTYFTRYSGTVYISLAILIIACGWFIFGGSSDNSSTVEHLERAQEQQHNSLELNQSVKDSVDRSAQLNQQGSERITRIEEYQQQASERIDESTSRLDEAEKLLTRNEQLIERVEQGHQTRQEDGTKATPPTEHVGVD